MTFPATKEPQLDFGLVSLSKIITQSFTLHNVSSLSLERFLELMLLDDVISELRSNLLDTRGPFSIVQVLFCLSRSNLITKAFRELQPGAKQTLTIKFDPKLHGKYQERLEISSKVCESGMQRSHCFR